MNQSTAAVEARAQNEIVIVVHGIGSNRLIMWPLATRIRKAGFHVIQWSYPSWFTPLASHIQQFASFIGNIPPETKVHVVAHSMGAIIARGAIMQCDERTNIRRLVQLAPPNHGSPVARIVGKMLGRMLRPLPDLSDAPTSYVNCLPVSFPARESTPPIELGIIAAKYDLLVPLKSTYLASAREHIVLAASHNSLLLSPMASELVIRFLRSGTFEG